MRIRIPNPDFRSGAYHFAASGSALNSSCGTSSIVDPDPHGALIWLSWSQIQIGNADPNMDTDLHWIGSLDPDPPGGGGGDRDGRHYAKRVYWVGGGGGGPAAAELNGPF
jgi:hypothetical protein